MNHLLLTHKPSKRTQQQPQSKTGPAPNQFSDEPSCRACSILNHRGSPLITMCWQITYIFLCSCHGSDCTSHRFYTSCPNPTIAGRPPNYTQPVQVCEDPRNPSVCKHTDAHKSYTASETPANTTPSLCRQVQLSCNWKATKGLSHAASYRGQLLGLSLPVMLQHQECSRCWERWWVYLKVSRTVGFALGRAGRLSRRAKRNRVAGQIARLGTAQHG